MNFIKRNFLFAIVFITGAAVLIIEISATRILAPYFGNTLFATSSIIGIILGALSLGYYFGGKLSDKFPKYSCFFLLIIAAGIFSLLIKFLSDTILPILGSVLGLRMGPPVASLIIFTPPSIILGMMSPFAVKLSAMEMDTVGEVSGKVFFWSTVGSIFGSFLSGFYLIPHWGLDVIMITNGLVLVLIGVGGFLFSKTSKTRKANLLILTALITGSCLAALYFGSQLFKSNAIIFQEDGKYSQITVKETGIQEKQARILLLDRSLAGGVFKNYDMPPFDYTKFYKTYEVFSPNPKKALVLGGGTYSVPKKLLTEEENIERVDVVEIEPSLYELSKKYFKLKDDNRLCNHVADGRRFLQNTSHQYDFIFSDAYNSLYSIPVHLTTKNFFERAKEKLTKDGIFMINVIGTRKEGKNKLLFSEIKTFKSVFENSYYFAVDHPDRKETQNFIFIGLKDNSKDIDLSDKKILTHKNRTIRSLPDKQINIKKLDLNPGKLLTDNFAPVEYYTAQLFE